MIFTSLVMGTLTRIAKKVLSPVVGDRTPCPLCCLKHLGQARALLLEARKGYMTFFWFALGHLAEAEDEIVLQRQDLADAIREQRKNLERNPAYQVEFDRLVSTISIELGLDPTEFLKETPK